MADVMTGASLIRLSESDKYFLNEQGMIMVSFYKKNSNLSSPQDIKTVMIKRFSKVVNANPWITSRLVDKKKMEDDGTYLSYNNDAVNPLLYVSFSNDDSLFQKDINERSSFLCSSLLKPGIEIINRNEKLFSLQIVENTVETEVAILFCMNHCLGDGHTGYAIWRMLDVNEEIFSMNPERDYSFEDMVKQHTSLLNVADVNDSGFCCDVKNRVAQYAVHQLVLQTQYARCGRTERNLQF